MSGFGGPAPGGYPGKQNLTCLSLPGVFSLIWNCFGICTRVGKYLFSQNTDFFLDVETNVTSNLIKDTDFRIIPTPGTLFWLSVWLLDILRKKWINAVSIGRLKASHISLVNIMWKSLNPSPVFFFVLQDTREPHKNVRPSAAPSAMCPFHSNDTKDCHAAQTQSTNASIDHSCSSYEKHCTHPTFERNLIDWIWNANRGLKAQFENPLDTLRLVWTYNFLCL